MFGATPVDTESVPLCVMCNVPGARDRGFERFLALEEPFSILRCGSCGLRWLSPRPTADEYMRIYGYERYFDGAEAVEHYPSLAAERYPYFLRRLEFIESLFSPQRPLRILDVGAATGEFVHAAMTRRHDAVGLEISEGAIKQAAQNYGVQLLDERLGAHAPEEPYDVIHMNHVLEHMPDPLEVGRAAASLLRPGGIWAVEVPQQFENDLDRLRRLSGFFKPKFNLYSLHHTYFFHPEQLLRLVQESGFNVILSRTANAWRTPLWPFTVKNLVLRVLLGIADVAHSGGNIIEVYARKGE